MQRYFALLRGINVGTKKRIEMKTLIELFESLGYTAVSSYINSGNIIFNSKEDKDSIRASIQTKLEETFSEQVPALVKTGDEMKAIAAAIPDDWKNDKEQKTDVAYLFEEADYPGIIDELPLNRDYIDVLYIKGAVIWNVERVNFNKSRLNKIAGHRLYKFMTVRNVNTARHLAAY